MSRLVLEGVTKTYRPGGQGLGPVDLAVEDGEVLALIGPSGSGKTTLLRLVAGLEDLDTGAISVDGARIDHLPARKRNVAMVLEQGGLYAKMTARSNIGFPLGVRAVPPSEIDARVGDEARALAIEDLLDRRPNELSAGEQQMVKTARAVVAQPSVLLLDEPLSQVDPSERAELRRQVLMLQRRHGVSTIWVSSDHHEAFAVADRVAVLIEGTLRQIDVLDRLWRQPADTTIAGFVGEPAMALLDLPVTRNPDGGYDLVVGASGIRLWSEVLEPFVSSYVTAGVRPEDVEVGVTGGMDALVHTIEHLPTGLKLTLTLPGGGGQRLAALVRGRWPRPGERLGIRVPGTAVHLFDPVSGAAILHPL